MDCGIFSVGHILVDMRVKVNELIGSDQFNEIQEVSYGIGGSAANVAIGFTRLGGACTLVGKIGIDDFGRMTLDELMKEKISIDHVKTDLRERTGFTIVIIDKKGEISMYGSKGASESLEPEDVTDIKVRGCKYVHIASLRMDTAIATADLSKRNGLFVTFDPGRELVSRGIQYILPIFRYMDLLLLNRKEASALTGSETPEKATSSLKKSGAKNVIVKLGGRGVYFLTDESEGIIPAYKIDAIDTTGAGDAFVTGLLMSLGKGYNLKESITYANAVAAMKATKLGSHTIPTQKEVDEFLSSAKTV